MILKIKRFFKSRKTVLSLMLLLSSSVLLSFLVPQQATTPGAKFAKWQAAHQALRPITDFLGLHRLFTTRWFVGILFLFLVSLAITSIEQFQRAYRKTFDMGPMPPFFPSSGNEEKKGGFSSELAITEQALVRNLRREGFFKVAGNDSGLRCTIHPWGYWGNFLLHIGILITVAASLFMAATQQRGVVRLIEGKSHLPSSPWRYEEHGIFTGPLRLHEALRLDQVTPEFGPQGEIKHLTSVVRFTSANGQTTKQTFAMDTIVNHKGLRIFPQHNFGQAFYVVLTEQTGEQGMMILDFPAPLEPTTASYGNFDFTEVPYHIKAKYYADVDKRTLISDNPLLVIRLMDHKRVLGELSLQQGESGQLGPYKARLMNIKEWTEFVFVNTPGILWVFFGFFIIILGGILNYFTVPREFLCRKQKQGFLLTWQGSRFKHLYQDEGRAILLRLMEQTRHE